MKNISWGLVAIAFGVVCWCCIMGVGMGWLFVKADWMVWILAAGFFVGFCVLLYRLITDQS